MRKSVLNLMPLEQLEFVVLRQAKQLLRLEHNRSAADDGKKNSFLSWSPWQPTFRLKSHENCVIERNTKAHSSVYRLGSGWMKSKHHAMCWSSLTNNNTRVSTSELRHNRDAWTQKQPCRWRIVNYASLKPQRDQKHGHFLVNTAV